MSNTHKHSPDLEQLQKRRECRDLVACPTCAAAAGSKCVGVRGQIRPTSHAKRWEAYKEKLKSISET
jgi:hypothetical protein